MTSRDYQPTRNLIAAGHRLLEAVDARAPGAIRRAVYADPNVGPLPALTKDWMVERLVRLTHNAANRLRDQLELAAELVDAAGSPSDLQTSADTLDAHVVAPAEALAPVIRIDKLEATQKSAWTGSGADLYRAAVDGQDAAVLRISEAGRRNSQVMRDTATALSEFVSAITWEVVGIVGAAVSLTVAIAALLSAQHLTIVIASFAAALLGTVAAIGSAAATIQSTLTAMSSLVTESKTPIVAWPDARFGDAR